MRFIALISHVLHLYICLSKLSTQLLFAQCEYHISIFWYIKQFIDLSKYTPIIFLFSCMIPLCNTCRPMYRIHIYYACFVLK